LFVRKLLKYLGKVGDLQHFFNFGTKANHFHRASLLDDIDVDTREFANAGTVQILQPSQIEENILSTLLKQRLNGVPQSANFKKCKMPGDRDQRHLILLADLHRKIHEE